ncbi:MAG: hypothetical protein HY684_05915 [Chloroflexi bacterium]|nr:hypothetical protein [Chloroflexota bacterium]
MSTVQEVRKEEGPLQGRGLTLAEAALALGVSLNTCRRWVKKGRIPSERVETPQGYEYRVFIENVGKIEGEEDEGPHGDSPTVERLLTMLDERDRRIADLERDRMQLAARCGFLEGQNQQLQENLRTLMAKALPAAPVGTQPGEGQSASRPRRWWWPFGGPR